MKLDAPDASTDNQQQEREDRPGDGDPGRGDFLEGQNGDED